MKAKGKRDKKQSVTSDPPLARYTIVAPRLA